MPGGKGGAQRIEPFSQGDRENVIDPLIGGVQGLGPINSGDINSAFGMNDIQKQAQDILTTLNPNSFMQGAQGSLGGAQGLFNQASGGIGSDPFGAQAAMQRFNDPGFTDVQNNPQVQNMLQANNQMAQEFFNQNKDALGGAAQRASGGVGAGSGSVNANKEAMSRSMDLLNRQNTQTLLGEQGRRQGLQFAAAQQGANRDLQQAGLLGQLGTGLGNLGLGQGGLGANLLGQQLGGLMGLGGQQQQMGLQQALLPMQSQMQLAQLLKSSAAANQPGWFDTITGGLGQLGQAAGGTAQIIGLSDRYRKKDIREARKEVDELLDTLKPYIYKYEHGDEDHVGVMAQDLEKSSAGKATVIELPEGKHVDMTHAAFLALAAVARINERLKKLEESNGQ